MSATVAAALKKIAVAILTDKKLRKAVLGIVLGIIIIVIMPAVAVIALFNGDINIDADRLQQIVVEEMSDEEKAKLQAVEDTMKAIETAMTEKGFTAERTKEAQALYTLALYDHSKADGFVDKLVGCFAENQTDEQLINAINSAFGTELKSEDYSKVMNSIRANSINTSGFTDPHSKNNLDLVEWAKQAQSHGWGYVWGSYGEVLTQKTLNSKAKQYPDEVGSKADFIKTHWLGRRTADCIGLIKGYGWLNTQTGAIEYGTNGMPDVYFEEQGIHSIDPASEFYITIYGSIAQSESENISANVKWGKAQSAKQGNVPFQCKHFLGYTKNADGEIEIVPEEAEIIREIYECYLSGESLYGIKCCLEEKEIPTPAGCSVWRQETIRSILSNEKYKGDAIINKTYVSDCISKRVKVNNGERNKYYIENNHPAIIDAGTFARVQEEIARRSGKPKVKQKGTKTELSRYSSKYALSELLICGECRTPYRRCTWTAKGKRKIVWRCINRLDYGKKYCHHSPSIEESLLQDAVMRAIMQTARQNAEVLKTLKIHIGMGLTDEIIEDKTLDIQIRIAEIDAEFQKMLKAVSADNADGIDEERITELMNEKQRLTVQLEQYATMRQKRESAKSRLDEIYTILDGLQNHPMEYDDKLVRQLIECVVVESKEKIKVVFIGGTEIEMTL